MKRESTEGDQAHLVGEDAVAKVRQLLPKFRTAMMVTRTDDGEVHMRPLALQGDLATFGGVLWFFVDARSRKVHESERGAPVSISCQSDESNAYLHLTGTASIVRDMAKMRELYSPLIKTWFPDGLDDPNLTLMKFEATDGNYWDSPGGMLQVLGGFAKAVTTGRPAAGGNAGSLHI